MPGDDTSDDVLWLTVLRSGATQIEKLDMKSPDSMDEAVYVDCSRTIEYETPTDTVTVPHLANESVDALADNAVLPVKTLDASGIGTYDRPFSRITIGYPIAAKVRLLRPELPANGTSQGKKRQLQEQTLRLYRSLGGKVVANGKTSSILPLVPGTYRLGDYFPAFTGDKKLEINAAADYDGSVDIASDEPVPFNLLAVMTRYALLEV
jgi:hypothetical protein